MSASWTVDNIPDQNHRTILVTGANSGLGLEAATALAGRGATVVLACRDLNKAAGAAEKIRQAIPAAKLDNLALDLGSLDSIRAAAQEFKARHDRLDILINNAGIMMTPYALTKDGFESQFGTNHLGHFALTGLLLDELLETPKSRVVNVSSLAHRRGPIDVDDLHWQKRDYTPTLAYAQSKLANLLFTYELQRRLANAQANTIAVAAHPGIARTQLSRHLPGYIRLAVSPLTKLFFSRVVQDASAGALPELRAATDPGVEGGEFYGPGGPKERTGHPVIVQSVAAAHDAEIQRKLWDVSQQLTAVSYAI